MKPAIVPFFIAHQGCPHTCVFCDQEKISGGAPALPHTDEVLGRITAYRATVGTRRLEAAFFGGSFTCLPRAVQERLLAPLQPLLATGVLHGVRISTRPDAIDRETVNFLANRGVGTVELGVQSFDDAVLDRSGRGHTAGDAERACRILAGTGMQVGLQLMPGLPGDTPAIARATLRRAIALHPAFLRIYPTLVIAGTQLDRLWRAGRYAPLTLSGAVHLCKVMLHETLRNGIPVVRIGLQATDELRAGGAVAAGPWHPAFRQLVEAELFFDLLSRLVSDVTTCRPAILYAAPARVSAAAGQQRANLRRLRCTHGVKISSVKADPGLSPLELRLEGVGFIRRGSVLNDLNYPEEGSEDVW